MKIPTQIFIVLCTVVTLLFCGVTASITVLNLRARVEAVEDALSQPVEIEFRQFEELLFPDECFPDERFPEDQFEVLPLEPQGRGVC